MYYFWVSGRSPSNTKLSRKCGLLKLQDIPHKDKDRRQIMTKQAPKGKPHHSADVAAWYLLADFSLREFSPERARGNGWMAGFLSLPLQELDPSPDFLANLEAMLARFANEVWGDLEQGGRVRVFCQRKIIDDVYLERAAPQLDPAAQAIRDSAKKMNGGWGYYAIEKGSDSDRAACQESCHIIEIYVYRESIDTP